MEIFHSATDTELLVADMLTDLPRMILILDSHSAIHEFTLPKNWACKRKRSSSSSSSETISTVTALASMAASTTTGEETLTPTLLRRRLRSGQLCLLLFYPLMKRINRRKKRRIRECLVVHKPETRSLPLTVAKTYDEILKPSETNPTKKIRRENLSEHLSKVSQQRQALARGVEDALRFYERVKAYDLQLEEKEKELKLCLEREEQATAVIDNHWLALRP